MSRFSNAMKKPAFILAVILPAALIVEFLVLESIVGISLPFDRGSAVSSYEIREKGTALHFITRNKRFTVVDLWNKNGDAVEALVLRESFEMDRQDGIEGAKGVVKVEALDNNVVRWSFEEAGESGRVINQVYEVTEPGCCDAPTTYTYFSLRDGKKLRTTHSELSSEQLTALMQSL